RDPVDSGYDPSFDHRPSDLSTSGFGNEFGGVEHPAAGPQDPPYPLTPQYDGSGQAAHHAFDPAPPGGGHTRPGSALETRLNPKYTFETFVIGSSNRFAHAAAVAV